MSRASSCCRHGLCNAQAKDVRCIGLEQRGAWLTSVLSMNLMATCVPCNDQKRFSGFPSDHRPLTLPSDSDTPDYGGDKHLLPRRPLLCQHNESKGTFAQVLHCDVLWMIGKRILESRPWGHAADQTPAPVVTPKIVNLFGL